MINQIFWLLLATANAIAYGTATSSNHPVCAAVSGTMIIFCYINYLEEFYNENIKK